MNRLNWETPLGITVIALFVVGLILYVIGIFKKDIGYREWQIIVEDRKGYLPLFRSVVDKMVIRYGELSVIAGQLPLETYYDKYLKLNNTFKQEYSKLSKRDDVVRRKLAIIVSLFKKGFYKKNTYLSELVVNDAIMTSLNTDYSAFISRINDKKLKSNLDLLMITMMQINSAKSISEMAKNAQLPLKDAKFYNTLYDKPKTLENWGNRVHSWVNDRFEILLNGGDYE